MVSRPIVERTAAAVGATAYIVLGAVVPWKGTGDGSYTHGFEYVIGYAFTVALLAVAVAVGLFAGRSRRGTLLVRIGAVLLAAGVMWGNVTGDDPSWFFLLGGPGNVLMLVGLVLVARALWPDRGTTRAIGILLALSVPLSLVGAEVGGSFLAALAWALVALNLVGHPSHASTSAQAQTASATL